MTMATTTIEQILKVELYFVDGDTRTQTINNARTDITAQEIQELQTLIRQGNTLIGDKDHSTFGKIRRAIHLTRGTTKGIYSTTPTGKKN